jgi:hypothetical protein
MGDHRLTTGHVHDRGLNVGAAKGNSRWERRRAARTVAHHAVDAADAAELLEMIGLTAADGLEKGEVA